MRCAPVPWSVLALVCLACRIDGAAEETASDDAADDGDPPKPEPPAECERMPAQDVTAPDAVVRGTDCNEAAVRAAVEAGGTIVIDCPDAPIVLAEQLVVGSDTVIDGSGTTVLDGGGTTRILYKQPGPTLWLQDITLQHGQAPEALGDPDVTQANWFEWAGGAINVQCHDNSFDVGGGLFANGLVCRDNATGSHTRDPVTGQILDTGNGGCVYAFQCTFHCDDCTFSGNRATNGGAIGTLGAKVRLTASTCTGNEARYDASDNDNRGCGGCLCQDGTETAPGTEDTNYVEICGNVLADNRADSSGGAVNLFYRQQTRTSFRFAHNRCEGNSAGESGELYLGGGCLYVYVDTEDKIEWAPDVGPDTFVVSSNAFLDNSAEYLGGGAAIYNIWNTAARVDNNLFTGNEVRTTDQSSGGGGALGLIGAFFDLEHNTIVDNRANNWSGGVHLGAGAVALRNNLFARNSAPYTMDLAQAEASEHVNWKLDETDDGEDDGFLVHRSGGNLYFPTTTAGGEPRPTPGLAVDRDPELGALVDDAFPPYLPPLPTSPAVDAGIAVDGVPVDMRGEPRTDTPDIGAVELAD